MRYGTNFPNMSYCMFENTNAAMEQILNHIAECEEEDGIRFSAVVTENERPYFDSLARNCALFLEAIESFKSGSDDFDGEEE